MFSSSEALLEPQPIKVYQRRKAVLFDEVWAGGLATLVRAKDTGDIYGFGLNNYNQMGELGYKLSVPLLGFFSFDFHSCMCQCQNHHTVLMWLLFCHTQCPSSHPIP